MQLTDIIQPLSKSLQFCLWFDTKLKLICINVLIFRMASDSVVKCDRQREETRDFHTSHVNVYLAEKRIMEAIINLCLLESISNFQHHGSIAIRAKKFSLRQDAMETARSSDFCVIKIILNFWF